MIEPDFLIFQGKGYTTLHALAHVPTITNSIWKCNTIQHIVSFWFISTFFNDQINRIVVVAPLLLPSKFMVLCAYRSQQSAVLLLRNAHVFIRPFANLFQLGSCLAGQGISNGLNYLSPHGWPQDPIKTGKREKERWQCCLVVRVLANTFLSYCNISVQ